MKEIKFEKVVKWEETEYYNKKWVYLIGLNFLWSFSFFCYFQLFENWRMMLVSFLFFILTLLSIPMDYTRKVYWRKIK